MSTSPKSKSASQDAAAGAAASSAPSSGTGDAELSKILDEVESLQREIAQTRNQADGVLQYAEENCVSELGAPSSEGSLEETLGGMKIEESVGDILSGANASQSPAEGENKSPASTQARAVSESPVDGAIETEDPLMDEALKTINEEIGRLTGEDEGAHAAQAGSAPDGALKLTLRGQMSLQLEFEASGQGVFVATEGDKLIVRLSNGAEFRIPLDAAPARLRRIA